MCPRALVVLLITCTCAAQTPVISGVVTDARTRLPLQGAAVTAGSAIARTDSEGRYALSVEPSTGLQIMARRTGYFVPAALSAPLNITTGETIRRDFELRPLLKISGIVEDYDTGERLPGCHVFAQRRIYALGRAWHVPAGLITADARDGTFEIRNLEPGNYVVEIVPEDALPVSAATEPAKAPKKFHGWSYYPDASRPDMAAPITVTDAGDVPVHIRLRRREPRAISGTVTVPAVMELLRYFGDDIRTVATGTLSAAGPFRIDNLPEGDYHLVARAANDLTADLPITIGDNDISNLRVAPAPAAIVTGTVRTDDGSPLPEKLRFALEPLRLFGNVATERQARIMDGRFQIAARPGDYWPRITELPSNRQLILSQSDPVRADGTARQLDYVIVNRRGTLSGNARDSEYLLLPGTTLAGEFSIDLAPGKHQYIRLDGDELQLAGNRDFLQAKAAQAVTIEIKAGETTLFQP